MLNQNTLLEYIFPQSSLLKQTLIIININLSMQKSPQTYHRHLARQYSFSHLQEISLPLNTKPQSRFKPSPFTHKSSIQRRSASPLHNLHYKYLPDNYISPEKPRDSQERSKTRRNASKQNESRTEGIQKINSKIKNILESIEQQEKRKEIYVEKYSRDLHPHISNQSSSKMQYFKDSQRSFDKDLSSYHRQQYKTPLKDKNMNHIQRSNYSQYSNLSSIKDEKQSPYYSKSREMLKETNSDLKISINFQQNQQESSAYSLMNSRYQTYSISRIKKYKENQAVLVKGKNVDNQIDRIQLKIQELQKIKKNMHIDFACSKVEDSRNQSREKMESTQQQSKIRESASLKSSILESFARTNPTETKEESKGQPQQPKKQEQLQPQPTSQNMAKSQLINPNPNPKINQQDVPLPKLLRNLTNKKKKEPNTQKPPPTDFNQIQSSVSEFFNTNTQTPQSLQTNRQPNTPLFAQAVNAALTGLAGETPIKQQEKQLPSKAQVEGKDEVKRLLQNLQNQIKLDEQLRKAKKWFQRMRKQTKWQELQSILKKSSTWEGIPSMKIHFSITSQEQNPFYSPRESDFMIPTLIQSLQQSQTHWKKTILRGYSSLSLQHSGFTQQNIDVSKRGVISIEDLVRYINYQLDTFYRNRDLYLIFNRFKQSQSLRYRDILQCLSQ